MGGGGRRISRLLSGASSSNNKSNAFSYTSSTATGLSFSTDERYGPMLEMKHIQIPPLPRESPIVFEFILMLHVILFTSLQYLHLYRTVWWLPKSFNHSGIKLELIDVNVLIIIMSLLGRRLPYLVVKYWLPNINGLAFHIVSSTTLGLIILYNCVELWWGGTLNFIRMSYIFGPLVLYTYAFGVNINSIWDVEELDRPKCDQYSYHGPHNHSSKHSCTHHVCSNDPFHIRNEVDNLRNLFNNRIQRVLCYSILVAYYSCFLPWSFVQTYINYDMWWVYQHCALAGSIVFSLLMSRAFCPDFCDGLHKAACHLGRWSRLLRPTHIPSNVWANEYLFIPGAIVKHQRDLYKAEGILCVASEPGNNYHDRFQILFSGSLFARLMLGFHASLLLLTVLVFLRISEWYQLISICIMIFTLLYTFVRLGRDFLVVCKMYEAEDMILKQEHHLQH